MRSSNKCITECAVLLSFILVISTAGATADNNNTNVFNTDTYQLPVLQFDRSQEKVVASEELSPVIAGAGTFNGLQTTAAKSTLSTTIPTGSIIYHSKEGVTTVFDQTGKQLFAADDASAGLISTPGEYKPATMVHELPSGSVLYPSGNITYVVFNNKVILVEINDNPMHATENSRPAPINNISGLVRAKSMGASSVMDFDPNKVFLERVGLEHYFSTYDDDIKVSSVQWVVPAAPKTVRPSQIQYLEFTRVANDYVYYYDNSTPGGVNSYNSILYFATVSEWNRYSNTWDMSTWIQNTNISMPTYYSTGIHVNTGNKLTGEIISRYDLNSTARWNNTEYWSAGISNPVGQTSNLSLVARNMESVLNTGNPVEYLFEVSGDYSASSEENFIGDTTFSDFIFTSQNDLPISAGTIPVWCVYVHSAIYGKPGFMDMRIENKWPVSLLLGTQALAPEGYTFSITQVGNPGWPAENLQDLANMTGNGFAGHLSENGWTQVFRKRENEVSKEDFGTTGGGLNDATFHFHIGHGAKDSIFWGNTFLALGNGQFLHASDVDGKWGGKNKWVFLDSCDILDDNGWGKALVTTHGIFGFSTYQQSGPGLVDQFFAYATWPKYRYTLAESYHRATMDEVDDATAKVIFDNEDQYLNDHLPGIGIVAPDENPDDDYYYKTDWAC